MSTKEREMSWIEEYTMLWHLALEWDNLLDYKTIIPNFSKENPYLETTKICYLHVIVGE